MGRRLALGAAERAKSERARRANRGEGTHPEERSFETAGDGEGDAGRRDICAAGDGRHWSDAATRDGMAIRRRRALLLASSGRATRRNFATLVVSSGVRKVTN